MSIAGGIRNMISGVYDSSVAAGGVAMDVHLNGGTVGDAIRNYTIGLAVGKTLDVGLDLFDN